MLFLGSVNSYMVILCLRYNFGHSIQMHGKMLHTFYSSEKTAFRIQYTKIKWLVSMAIFAYLKTLSHQIHSKNINTFEFIIP